MKKLYFESTTTLTFDAPVVNHHFLLRYLPPSFPGQSITSATLILRPGVPYTLTYDGFGNLNQTGWIPEPHTEFVYSVRGRALVDLAQRRGEALLPLYKYPSACTRPCPGMAEFVAGLGLGGSVMEQALALAHAVYDFVQYTSGVTGTDTTAAQVFLLRKGVCQDFAHLYLAMARLAGIPARYANGLPIGEGQSHAWVEVYAGGGWVGVDPTRNRLAGEDYIRFCVGRDFKDCALERGVLFGDSKQSQQSFTVVSEQ